MKLKYIVCLGIFIYVSVDEKRESKKLAAVIIATGGKALSGKNVSLCPQSYH